VKLQLNDFSYTIPEELIAQSPLENRSQSRLLIRHPDGHVIHSSFSEIARHISSNTILVYNDSKVIPGRILTQTENGGKLELMLLRPLDSNSNSWLALAKPFRKFKEGLQISIDDTLQVRVTKVHNDQIQPCLEVTFNRSFNDTLGWLELNGYVPLPPYIQRPQASPAKSSRDKERYQTVYARHLGSVAAPTAGLHFTPEIWQELQSMGVKLAPITLHVGGGTFLPVKSQEIGKHEMHTEVYRIPEQSWHLIQKAKEDGDPIVCVGTTSLRCLESFARKISVDSAQTTNLVNTWLETNLFIYPESIDHKVKPWGIKGLITNFHQPESSLLMLVSALIGYRETKDLYEKAIEEKYRFYSYGDASLLWLE
jgi:S-adenosylmethionine:tRNA ribosyltransferase-isomerase